MHRSPITRFLVVFLALVLVISVAVACGSSAEIPTADRAALNAAADWIVSTHQNADGGYTSWSQGADLAPSDVNQTLDVVMALASLGSDPAEPRAGASANPVAYLEANAAALADYAAATNGQAGKAVMALIAAGADPEAFAGEDLVATLAGHTADIAGLPATDPTSLSLTILGLAAADQPVPAGLVEALVALQANEGDLAGSWDDGYGTAGNADATAMAVMALAAIDAEVDDSLVSARAFLAGAQDAGGGFAYAPGFPASANSTALVVQALGALDEPYGDADGEWAVAGKTPLDALLAFQSDSGAFQVDFGDGPHDDFFATVQSLPAATGLPLPLPAWAEVAP